MLCNIILTYILLFNDGRKENHEKWVDNETAASLVELMKGNPKDLDPDLKAVQNIKQKEVPAFDCFKGPGHKY